MRAADKRQYENGDNNNNNKHIQNDYSSSIWWDHITDNEEYGFEIFSTPFLNAQPFFLEECTVNWYPFEKQALKTYALSTFIEIAPTIRMCSVKNAKKLNQTQVNRT